MELCLCACILGTLTFTHAHTLAHASDIVQRIDEGGYCTYKRNGFYDISPGRCIDVYYVCVTGVTYLMSCPSDSVYSDQQRICVEKHNIRKGCAHNLDNFFSCEFKDDGFYYRGHCSVSQYQCFHKRKYVSWCSESRIFDPGRSQCVLARESTECSDDFKTGFSCARRPNGLYPSPDICSAKYFGCYNEVLHTMVCPDGTVYDQTVQTCEDGCLLGCVEDRGVALTHSGAWLTLLCALAVLLIGRR